MRIRPATLADCPRIARIHEAELRDDLIHALGHRFLNQFYRVLIGSPHGVCFVAEDQGELLGFAAGARDKAALNSEFLRRSWWNAPIFLLPVMHRSAVWKCLVTLARGDTDEDAIPAELLYIAVSRSARGKGIGTAVFKAFKGSLDEFRIVTGFENSASNRLYESMGCERIAQALNASKEPINVYRCHRGRD